MRTKSKLRMSGLAALLVLASVGLYADDNLVGNPLSQDLWTRDVGQGSVTLAANAGPGGEGAVQVSHRGSQDWSLNFGKPVTVIEREVYEFTVKIKNRGGSGIAQLSCVARDASGQVLDWMYGVQTTSAQPDWVTLQTKVVIPRGVDSLQLRCTGEAPGVWLISDPSLVRVRDSQTTDYPTQPTTIAADHLELTLDPKAQKLTLRQDEMLWTFDAREWMAGLLSVTKTSPSLVELRLLDPTGNEMKARFEAKLGFVEITFQGSGKASGTFAFPGPLWGQPGQSWALPVNEGLLIPADVRSELPFLKQWELSLYSGHGLCMPFVALCSPQRSLVAIVETPDDALVRYQGATTGPSSLRVLWQPTRGSWGYERRLRLTPVIGDYVAAAKVYREYAREHGLLVTLREKAKTVPQVDKLVGAVNLWWWKRADWWSQDDQGAAAFGQELKSRGIDRILWSHEQKGSVVDQLNALGFLTGRYDIFQDVWGPDNPRQGANHEGWPDDLAWDANGRPTAGWVDRVAGRDYVGGVISSPRSLVWEKLKVPLDLKDHAYGARFIDTTTASPLREDYNPRHPLSRTEDKGFKTELLAWLSRDQHLVVGSETGMDFAVPSLHYFEGMMSLGPFRLPDSGYDLTTYKVPTEDFKVFQVGTQFRIPLFELVYHDCVVSYWYWGDSSNRVPEFWDERDLFNALYGTGPLWILDPSIWNQHRDRFVLSYKKATSVARATGYSEMLEHRFLTADHTVQSTLFADGTRVVANFGKAAFVDSSGASIPAKTFAAFSSEGKLQYQF